MNDESFTLCLDSSHLVSVTARDDGEASVCTGSVFVCKSQSVSSKGAAKPVQFSLWRIPDLFCHQHWLIL